MRSDVEIYSAAILPDNVGISFMGITPAGTFDLSFIAGQELLSMPNPSGRANSDVIRPYLNGKDLNQRSRGQWTIDFGTDMHFAEAAQYEGPFEYLLNKVKPERDRNKRDAYRRRWWIYAEPRPAMRNAFRGRDRYLATCMVAKHRIFVWLPTISIPANVVIVFGRDDDYFFGVLHSRLHEIWSLKMGTRLETRPRYTPTTCFETFPLPRPTAVQEGAISVAAKELDDLRNRWLNPPEWTREEIVEFPGSADGPWSRYVHTPDGEGIGRVRYSRMMPRDDDSFALLAKRTLTNLYNERPSWLEIAHATLDKAVFDAYGWEMNISDDEILANLLELNLARAGETDRDSAGR